MCHKFPVGAPLCHLPPFQHDDLICVPDGGQPVGYDQAGAAPAPDVLQAFLLGHGVDGAGGFVKDQQGRIGGQRPGDLQTLPLAAAEIQPAFRHDCFIAARQLHNILMDAGIHGGLYDIGSRHGFIEHTDVFPDRPGNLEYVLIYRGQGIHNHRPGDLPSFNSVKQDLAGPFLVKPCDNFRQGTLAAAGGAHHGSPASRLQVQVEVLDKGRVKGAVAEAYILQCHFAGKAVTRKRYDLVPLRVVQVVCFIAPHIVQTPHLHFRILQHVAQGQQLLHRLVEFGDQVVKGRVNTGGHDAFHDRKAAHRHDQGAVQPA